MIKHKRVDENKLLISLIGNTNGNRYSPNDPLPGDIDWGYLLKQAKKEGIFCPVYERLTFLDSQKKILNDMIRNELKAAYYSYISQSTDFYNQIKRFLESVEAAGLGILLLKGPTVDSLIYKDGLFRPRSDLDFTVREKDWPAFQNLLSRLGYYPDRAPLDYRIPEYVNSRIYSKEEEGALPLHIHRHVINNLYLMIKRDMNISMNKVWLETEGFKDYNFIFCLKPEMQLLYACEHALKHNYERLIFLYEIDRLIDKYRGQIIWDKLISLSGEFKLDFVLYYGFYFASEILSTGIPKNVLEILKPRKTGLGEKIFIKLTLDGKRVKYLSYVAYLSVYEGLDKLRFLLGTIFPPGLTIKGYAKRIRRLFING